jgi:hypothetical protein
MGELSVMGDVVFEGKPPYKMPVARDAKADVLDEIVQVTLRLSLPDVSPFLVPVRVHMTVDTAKNLLDSLPAAINLAEFRSR